MASLEHVPFQRYKINSGNEKYLGNYISKPLKLFNLIPGARVNTECAYSSPVLGMAPSIRWITCHMFFFFIPTLQLLWMEYNVMPHKELVQLAWRLSLKLAAPARINADASSIPEDFCSGITSCHESKVQDQPSRYLVVQVDCLPSRMESFDRLHFCSSV